MAGQKPKCPSRGKEANGSPPGPTKPAPPHPLPGNAGSNNDPNPFVSTGESQVIQSHVDLGRSGIYYGGTGSGTVH